MLAGLALGVALLAAGAGLRFLWRVPARPWQPPADVGGAGDALNLLASQPEAKRTQILVVDLFHLLLGRYPDAGEQRDWLTAKGQHARGLQALRAHLASDVEVANAIAGSLMDTPAYRQRMPRLSGRAVATLSHAEAAKAGAVLARALHFRDDVPRSQDGALVARLQQDFGLTAEGQHHAAVVRAMLRGITGSTDIGEHFLEDLDDDDVELGAMRTLLRGGRLLVLNGIDAGREARDVVVFGFDTHGQFLVRDPSGQMPEKVQGAFLMAFLRKPSTLQDLSGAGFWLDLPGTPTRTRCVQHAVASAGDGAARPPELTSATTNGMTGVLPGAEVNLTPLRIPPGEHTLRGTLSLTAAQIDGILHRAGSPAAGTGAAFVRWGQHYNLDPIFALAFFRRESTFGTHPRWVGLKPNGGSTRNIGNIRYVGRPNPQREPSYATYNGFRSYASWEDGIHDWFKLLAEDAHYTGLHTVERILPRYAPPTENDTQAYLQDVLRWVGDWRAEVQALPHASAVASPAPAWVEVECKPPDL